MAAYSLAFIGHTNLLMGTMDGIYQYSADEERIKKISDVEKSRSSGSEERSFCMG